jgi:hypothetical protein
MLFFSVVVADFGGIGSYVEDLFLVCSLIPLYLTCRLFAFFFSSFVSLFPVRGRRLERKESGSGECVGAHPACALTGTVLFTVAEERKTTTTTKTKR